MSPRKWDPIKAQRVLDVFDNMQGPPFLTTLADMAEVGYGVLDGWVRFGLALRDGDREQDPQAIWASTLRRKQAEWIDEKMKFVQESVHDKERAAAVKATQWALERLRRDVFDLSRAPKEAPKGETEHPKIKNARQAAEDLAKPELQ